jgi:hypothetical protein
MRQLNLSSEGDSGSGGEIQHATEHNIDILAPPGEGAPAISGEDGEQQPSPPPSPAPTGISEEALTRILQEVIPARQQTPPAEQRQPELTQEQYNQMFNVWQPPNDLIARLRSDDPATANRALLEMRDGIVKQQSTIAEARIQQGVKAATDAMEARLTPLQSFYQEQQNQALEAEFFETNKDLKPYAAIVDAVSAKVCGDGVKRSKKEVFDQVALHSRTVVDQIKKAAGVPAEVNGNGNGTPAPRSGGRQMATLAGGGQQGGRGGGAAPQRKPGMAIFDDAD